MLDSGLSDVFKNAVGIGNPSEISLLLLFIQEKNIFGRVHYSIGSPAVSASIAAAVRKSRSERTLKRDRSRESTGDILFL